MNYVLLAVQLAVFDGSPSDTTTKVDFPLLECWELPVLEEPGTACIRNGNGSERPERHTVTPRPDPGPPDEDPEEEEPDDEEPDGEEPDGEEPDGDDCEEEPDHDNGHGNDEDGHDESNPGNSRHDL